MKLQIECKAEDAEPSIYNMLKNFRYWQLADLCDSLAIDHKRSRSKHDLICMLMQRKEVINATLTIRLEVGEKDENPQ